MAMKINWEEDGKDLSYDIMIANTVPQQRVFVEEGEHEEDTMERLRLYNKVIMMDLLEKEMKQKKKENELNDIWMENMMRNIQITKEECKGK